MAVLVSYAVNKFKVFTVTRKFTVVVEVNPIITRLFIKKRGKEPVLITSYDEDRNWKAFEKIFDYICKAHNICILKEKEQFIRIR